jgi:3-oxoacyl-[acyl-carrier-protein] synthase-1
MFLMTRQPSAVALLGVGECSDAYHVSAPHPEGTGAKLAMTLALEAAGLDPDALDYLNLHGTATPLNDASEGRAVSAVFGDTVPCSSTKALTGHMLGAAGANEAAFLWLALDPAHETGALPPHVWDGCADPEIPALNLVSNGTSVSQRSRSAMMSNSFSFGGNNAAVILGRGWG